MTVVTVGIDLAKNVFAVHGVNAAGKAVLVKPLVRRAKLLELIATLPACLIGIEACTGAHYWAREFQKMGHTVRIMAPQLVSPYRMGGRHGKNDAADAAAICEAVTRPNMRFVPIKSVEQQGQLFVHRAHQGYVSERTALINCHERCNSDPHPMNRPDFPGECFICELRLPDHCFRWKHNKLFLLLPEEYGPAFPAIVDCYTSPPT